MGGRWARHARAAEPKPGANTHENGAAISQPRFSSSVSSVFYLINQYNSLLLIPYLHKSCLILFYPKIILSILILSSLYSNYSYILSLPKLAIYSLNALIVFKRISYDQPFPESPSGKLSFLIYILHLPRIFHIIN